MAASGPIQGTPAQTGPSPSHGGGAIHSGTTNANTGAGSGNAQPISQSQDRNHSASNMRANSKGRHPLDSKDSEENKNNNFQSGKNGRGSAAKDIYSQISGHMMNGGDNMMKKPPGASSYNTQQGFNKASSYTRGNSLTTAGVGGGGYKAVHHTINRLKVHEEAEDKFYSQ